MIDTNSIVKLFVRVPAGTVFNGASVSTQEENIKKIYFDENENIIWVNGKTFGLSKTQGTQLSTLIGTDTNKSVREIAQSVIESIVDWQGADADTVISTLKEVLNWFNNLPEGDEGAVALINKVGNPAVLYTAEEATAYNTEHAEDPDFEAVSEGDVKTAATGLYKLIEDNIQEADFNVSAAAKSGELLVNASASNNNIEVESTTKLQNAVSAAETSIQTISVAGISATKSGNINEKSATITKSDLQNALFVNHANAGTTTGTDTGNDANVTYSNISVSVTEQDGEITGITVNGQNLANRITDLEEFDPWEDYEAPVEPEQQEPGE